MSEEAVGALRPVDFELLDRGSISPDFYPVKINMVQPLGRVARMTVGGGFARTDASGSGQYNRSRNAVGVYCTNNWYRMENGKIVYGAERPIVISGDFYTDADTIAANPTTGARRGYQARKYLELKMKVGDADSDGEAAYMHLTDDNGDYSSAEKWLRVEDRQLTSSLTSAGTTGGKFITFEDAGLKIPSTAANPAINDGTGEPYAKGLFFIPENYDPARGIVFILQGNDIVYWKLPDGSNNGYCGFFYDTSITSWRNQGAIVVYMHDRSTVANIRYADKSKVNYCEYYDFVIDDLETMKHFINTYKVTGPVVLAGNSRGTMAGTKLIKALAGQEYEVDVNGKLNTLSLEERTLDDGRELTIDSYICQNGYFGNAGSAPGTEQSSSSYDDDDWEAVAATGIRVWCLDGERDINGAMMSNYQNIPRYTQEPAILELGDEWIKKNVRLSGMTSKLFIPWGESDHSVTRIVAWYFADTPYYGPNLDIGGDGSVRYTAKLSDGDTYTLPTYWDPNFSFTVYEQGVHEWALEAKNAKNSGPEDEPKRKSSSGGCDAAAIGLFALLPLVAFRRR